MGSDVQAFTAEDLRFTSKGDTLYAVALGWPGTGKLTIGSLWSGTPYVSQITKIEMLGSTRQLRWQQSKETSR
jgi:alpha-L-fucosidase